ncbi:MAG: GGDEF domain-containing protein [Mariprofundaceae bacterium]|nr:GGDEF domain-containing protein [Mariprofundaceae bacterium]
MGHSSRECDVVSRWGGEEFVLFLPEIDLASAMVIAERLRHDLAESVLEFEGQYLQVTASFGVSEHEKGAFLDDTIAKADMAMYHAKEQGRNRVLSA